MRTIEIYDTAAEAQKLGLQTRIICYEDAGPIEYLVAVGCWFDTGELDLGIIPERGESLVSGMVVPEYSPPLAIPPDDSQSEIMEVIAKGRGSFWYAGELCIPVKGDGYGSWLYLTPVSYVPGIKAWTADDEGRLVRVAGAPTVGHFIVRADERNTWLVACAAAIERISASV